MQEFTDRPLLKIVVLDDGGRDENQQILLDAFLRVLAKDQAEAANEAKDYEREQVRGAEERLKGQLVEKGGLVFNEVDQDAFRKAVEPLYEKYVKEYGADAGSFIKRIQETK